MPLLYVWDCNGRASATVGGEPPWIGCRCGVVARRRAKLRQTRPKTSHMAASLLGVPRPGSRLFIHRAPTGSTAVPQDATRRLEAGRSHRFPQSDYEAALCGSVSDVPVGLPICAEQPVPEEIDDREITVRMQMVDEVKLPHAPEPGKALQRRSLDVIRLVEIDMGVE